MCVCKDPGDILQPELPPELPRIPICGNLVFVGHYITTSLGERNYIFQNHNKNDKCATSCVLFRSQMWECAILVLWVVCRTHRIFKKTSKWCVLADPVKGKLKEIKNIGRQWAGIKKNGREWRGNEEAWKGYEKDMTRMWTGKEGEIKSRSRAKERESKRNEQELSL